jgi:hypothetical protein
LERHDNPDKILRRPRRKRVSVPNVSDNNVSDNVSDNNVSDNNVSDNNISDNNVSDNNVSDNNNNISEKNDGLVLEAVGADAPRLPTSSERSIGYQAVYSQDGTGSVEEDLQVLASWYRNVGYLIPLDKSAIDVLEQVLPQFTMNDIKRHLYKSVGDQSVGLGDRNVQMDPCLPPDPFLAKFPSIKPVKKSSIYLPNLHEKVKKYHTDEWRLDLEKAVKDELEATFQRTVMMSMLDRFRLMYNLRDGDQSVLDFAVESPWTCPFMPTRALKKDRPDRQRVLSRPKPDISVAFHLRSIIEDGFMKALPEATRRIMIYEAADSTRTQRAFHFLMIEAKNADKSSTDKDGRIQSLNSASQSLHCLYEFFNEADRQEVECNKTCCTPGTLPIADNATSGQGPSAAASAASAGGTTFVDLFFKEVRVFTAVATGRAITIRVHRALPASEPPFPPHPGRPPFQLIILPDYPLQFEYNEVINLTNAEFSRECLVDVFQKIMVDYGIGKLRPLLQKAAEAIANKYYKWEAKKGSQYVLGMRHYSHGQTAPPPPSRKNSQAASQSTRWSPDSGSSMPRRASRTSRASSRVSTISPVAHYPFTTQPVESQMEPPRKRKRRG